jgi:hypothetical protein
MVAASKRLWTPSLASRLVTCTLAFLGLMNSRSAIWRSERPSTAGAAPPAPWQSGWPGWPAWRGGAPDQPPDPKLPQLAGDRGSQRPGAAFGGNLSLTRWPLTVVSRLWPSIRS